jgi:hypothetical protein
MAMLMLAGLSRDAAARRRASLRPEAQAQVQAQPSGHHSLKSLLSRHDPIAGWCGRALSDIA